MNRENEEQRPVAQTLCGALQKEPNCKCLLLSVLIYTCLAAVTWCRCANVTKIMVNYTKFPIRSTKHVSSPCDEGYIYIPVAFMGMLYLVYLVECYHSPIRIDLLHAESQDSVLAKLAQLKISQPTIWWRAVSYHYVRRKRQITRYRNGDNYTTTQVYYERVNTHVATSAYYYDYCGVKDISKDLILGTKTPITKIMLTKGFAFSNMRSATEFEETRSRFFAEQELRDDYLEMREGLDIGSNVNPTMLVAVLGKPWFTNRYVYWCLSALLLSWPLRVIIEYKTQYADYQVTKLFGVNYDTPTSGEPIHTSMSQLSQPGSYMLAPSYSEALLMDPAPTSDATERNQEVWQARTQATTDMVPSYSEALLYERAEQPDHRNVIVNVAAAGASDPTTVCNANDPTGGQMLSPLPCECHCPCPCHGNAPGSFDPGRMNERGYLGVTAGNERLAIGAPPPLLSPPATTNVEDSDSFESQLRTLRTTADGRLRPNQNLAPRSMDDLQTGASPSRCGSCGRISTSTQTINTDNAPPRVVVTRNKSIDGSQITPTDLITCVTAERERKTGFIPRDISEPNLRSRAEPTSAYPKESVRSLGNILENEEAPTGGGGRVGFAATTAAANPPSDRLQVPKRQKKIPPALSTLALTHSRSLDETSISPGYASISSGYSNISPGYSSLSPGFSPAFSSLSPAYATISPGFAGFSPGFAGFPPSFFADGRGAGAIPKNEPRSRITVNPMSGEACWKLPYSRTNLCLKSILKQNRRRYTLVTADEFQNLADRRDDHLGSHPDGFGRSEKGDGADKFRMSAREAFVNPRRRMPSFEEFVSERDKAYANELRRGRDENAKTLIFASPIQEIPISDPFGGRDIVPSRSTTERRGRDDPANTPILARLGRSQAERDRRRVPDYTARPPYRRAFSVQQEHPIMYPFAHSHAHQHQHAHRFPSSVDHADDHVARTNETPRTYRNVSFHSHSGPFPEQHAGRRTMPHERSDRSKEGRPTDLYPPNGRRQFTTLTRSLTERRPKVARLDTNFRRSFTGRVEDYRTEVAKRTNFSMETSL